MRSLVVLVVLLIAGNAMAQFPTMPRIEKKHIPGIEDPKVDSVYYTIPPSDSARMYDSIYRARVEEVRRREQKNYNKEWGEHTININALVNTYGRFKAPDIGQFFSEVTGRPDPAGDRNSFSTIDRGFSLAGVDLLTPELGIYAEYSYFARWFNTLVDSALPSVAAGEHDLDYTVHSLVVGPEIIIYNTHILRIRANGGIGGAYVLLHEREDASGQERRGSTLGLAVNFDAALDFRVKEWVSFAFDFYTRSIQAGTFDLSGGAGTFASPFGSRSQNSSLDPKGNAVMFGLSLGLIFHL